MRLPPGEYVPELTAPEGVSTGGGVQALQRLRLVPQRSGFPTLVAGSANQKEGLAELRSWDHLDAIHRQRFKKPLPLDRASYDAFLELSKSFLDVLHLKTVIVGPSPSLVPAKPLPDDEGTGSSSTAIVVGVITFVAAVLLLGGLAYLVFGGKR